MTYFSQALFELNVALPVSKGATYNTSECLRSMKIAGNSRIVCNSRQDRQATTPSGQDGQGDQKAIPLPRRSPSNVLLYRVRCLKHADKLEFCLK